ncbi:MAG: antibiotic biosynthesis monooxygenase family protein [Thermoanaerobaculia bacterium]
MTRLMVMRFLRLLAREEKLPELKSFYLEQVLPALQATEGCLYAALLQHSVHPDECISLTLWRNRDTQQVYESTPVYKRLLERCEPFLQSHEAWKVRSFVARKSEEALESRAYRVETGAETIWGPLPERIYLRIVSVVVKQGALEEFKSLYLEHVVPALAEVDGCCGVFLVEDPDDPEKLLSVTLWESEERAVRYELAGLFGELSVRLRHTFEDLTSWSPTSAEGGSLADGLEVRGYNVVVAKRF